MSIISPPRRLYPLGLAILLGCILSACMQPPPRVEPQNLFWPLPPERPRIQYVKSIYTEDDLGRVYSLAERLFGKTYFDGMVRPYGVSVRGSRLLVSDIVALRVTSFDLEAKRIAAVAGFEGAFRMPAAVANDDKGTIFVADSSSSKVVVYNERGEYSTSFLVEGGVPVGLATSDLLGRLYVVDRYLHRVVVFDLQGKKLFEFGGRGNIDGKFNIPLDIVIARNGNVYVLDSGNFRVQVFTADGKFLRKFGEVGDRPGMFANPKGIALDSEEHVYVTDAAFSNFQIFDQTGSVLLFVGEIGSWPGYMNMPAGIAIDEKDYIYVADQLNSRIQVFRYLSDAAQTTSR